MFYEKLTHDSYFDTDQITEAVTLIARSRPENVRVSYISQFTAAAKAASPTPEVVEPVEGEEEEEDDEDKEEKKLEEDSEVIKAAKRKVVKDLVSSIKNLRLEGSDKEFEGFSNLILSLILSLFDASHSEFSTLFFILTDAVMFNAERTANPSLSARYTAVATIFNSLPATPSALRLTTLIKLIEFAASNDDFSVIHPALANFESWLVEWGFAVGTVGEEEGNRAVLSIANTLSSRNQQTLARTLILSRLSAPSAVAGKSATPSVSGATLASHLIVLSLSLTENFDFSTLSSLPYVASPSVPALASLLDIFQAGDVAAFQTFAKTHETMLKEQGLEVAALEKKLKLLALAELCSKKVGESVSYKEIAEALKVQVAADDDGEAVETWVIDGKPFRLTW